MSPLVIAVLIGLGFGFALDRVGATNANVLLRMLSLKDLHLAKTILLGIGLASTLMFAGQTVGLVDVGHMSVKASYLGVLIGGLILGLGWAFTGYCPGTGVAALASLRKDACAFVAGGLVGASLYALTYPWWVAADLIGDAKQTVGTIEGSGAAGVVGLPGQLVGLLLGVVFIGLAFTLPRFPSAPRPGTEKARAGVAVTN